MFRGLAVGLFALSIVAGLCAGVAVANDAAEDPPGTLFIDDTDTTSVETTFAAKPGKPHPSLTASGGTVTAFAHAKKPGAGENKVTISPTIEKPGWYQIWMRWTTYAPTVAQHADNVPLTVMSKTRSFDFKINQRSGNAWVLLGTYELDAGKRPVVTFSNQGTSQGANWDAIKLVPLPGKPGARPAPALPKGEDGWSVLARNIAMHQIALAYGRGDAETDPQAIQMIAAKEAAARRHWDLLLQTPHEKTNANWTAVNNTASFNLTREAGFLRSMAVAYAGASNHLGLDLRGNPELLKDTLRGIETFTKRYNDTTKWDVNWWDFEIGVPQNILPALIVLGDAVPAELRDSYVRAVKRFNSDPRKFYSNGATSTGANRLWLCNVAMFRAMLSRDEELAKLVQQSVVEPLAFVQRPVGPVAKNGLTDGYYADGSFIQHGGIPYVAAYGYLLLESYAEVAECLQGTPWQLVAAETDNAFRIIEICFDPFIVRGETVQNVVGRSLGAKNYEGNANTANFVVTASKLLPFAKPEQAARLRSLIKKWITEEPEGKLLELALTSADASNPRSYRVLREIADDAHLKPLPPRTGFEMFANMDVATHRTGDFAVSLGMNSTRTTTFETIWGANKRGWFQSEGLFLLYTPDIERYRDAYFHLVDHYRLPGTMVERFERKEGDGGGANPGKPGGGAFVGGVSLAGNGIAATHLKPAEGALEARRSWIFLGDQIVCLGAGIGAQSDNTIETTIENARLVDESQQLLIDAAAAPDAVKAWPGAKSVWLAGKRPGAEVGWAFLGGSSPALNTLVETREGSRAINQKNGNPAPLTMRFATLWFDHGKGMVNGSYAYAVLPGRTAQATAAYAEKPPVEVLANTPQLQAVRLAERGLTAIVGWNAGSVSDIAFDQPVLLMVQDSADTLSVAISDPTMLLSNPVKVQFARNVKEVRSSSERIKMVSNSPLVIEFDPKGANGQSHRIDLAIGR